MGDQKGKFRGKMSGQEEFANQRNDWIIFLIVTLYLWNVAYFFRQFGRKIFREGMNYNSIKEL